MKRMICAVALLALTAAMPVQPAKAQGLAPLIGGLFGAGVGAAVSNGKPGAIILGGVVGVVLASVLVANAQHYKSNFYIYNGRCYYKNPNGSWYEVNWNYCS